MHKALVYTLVVWHSQTSKLGEVQQDVILMMQESLRLFRVLIKANRSWGTWVCRQRSLDTAVVTVINALLFCWWSRNHSKHFYRPSLLWKASNKASNGWFTVDMNLDMDAVVCDMDLSADSERIECYEQVGAKHGRPYLKDLWVPVLSTVYANTVRCFCDRLFSVVMATAAWTCVMLLQPSAVRECVNSVWRWMPDKELACVTQCYVISVTFTCLNKISQYVVSIMSSVAVFLCHPLPTAVWCLAHTPQYFMRSAKSPFSVLDCLVQPDLSPYDSVSQTQSCNVFDVIAGYKCNASFRSFSACKGMLMCFRGNFC